MIAHQLDFGLAPDAFEASMKALPLPTLNAFIHLAAATPDTCGDPREYYLVNAINPRHLLQRLTFAPPAAVLNFSTASVYAPGLAHVTEDSPKTKTDDYGLSKHLFEEILEDLADSATDGTNNSGPDRTLSVRVPVLLAHGIGHNFISKWRTAMEEGGRIRLFNPDLPFNACVWIDDIFEFFVRFLETGKAPHLACNVGSLAPISIREAATLLMAQFGETVAIETIQSERSAQNFDCSLAQSFGFRPGQVSEAIKRYVRRT